MSDIGLGWPFACSALAAADFTALCTNHAGRLLDSCICASASEAGNLRTRRATSFSFRVDIGIDRSFACDTFGHSPAADDCCSGLAFDAAPSAFPAELKVAAPRLANATAMLRGSIAWIACRRNPLRSAAPAMAGSQSARASAAVRGLLACLVLLTALQVGNAAGARASIGDVIAEVKEAAQEPYVLFGGYRSVVQGSHAIESFHLLGLEVDGGTRRDACRAASSAAPASAEEAEGLAKLARSGECPRGNGDLSSAGEVARSALSSKRVSTIKSGASALLSLREHGTAIEVPHEELHGAADILESLMDDSTALFREAEGDDFGSALATGDALRALADLESLGSLRARRLVSWVSKKVPSLLAHAEEGAPGTLEFIGPGELNEESANLIATARALDGFRAVNAKPDVDTLSRLVGFIQGPAALGCPSVEHAFHLALALNATSSGSSACPIVHVEEPMSGRRAPSLRLTDPLGRALTDDGRCHLVKASIRGRSGMQDAIEVQGGKTSLSLAAQQVEKLPLGEYDASVTVSCAGGGSVQQHRKVKIADAVTIAMISLNSASVLMPGGRLAVGASVRPESGGNAIGSDDQVHLFVHALPRVNWRLSASFPLHKSGQRFNGEIEGGALEDQLGGWEPETLDIALTVSGPGVTNPSRQTAGAIDIVPRDEASSSWPGMPREATAHRPLPDIDHVELPPETMPSLLWSALAAGIAFLPFVLAAGWAGRLGVNVARLRTGSWRVKAFAGWLVGYAGVVLVFWVRLNLLQALPMMVAWMAVAVALGRSALSELYWMSSAKPHKE